MIELDYTNKEDIKDIIKIAGQEKGNICYVTLNKTCGYLSELFERKGIDGRFHFVDCVSAMIKESPKVARCEFIPVPYDLNLIEEAVLRAIKDGCESVIFDSLSSLIIYEPLVPAGIGIIKTFVEGFRKEVERRRGNIIFLCKEKDKEKLLIVETLPIFNKIKKA